MWLSVAALLRILSSQSDESFKDTHFEEASCLKNKKKTHLLLSLCINLPSIKRLQGTLNNSNTSLKYFPHSLFLTDLTEGRLSNRLVSDFSWREGAVAALADCSGFG